MQQRWESGCMQFIPGSHKEDLRWHRHIDNDPLIHGLTTDDVDPSKAIACPLAPGAQPFTTLEPCTILPQTRPTTLAAPTSSCAPGRPKKRDQPAPRPWTDDEREALAKAGIDVKVL